MEKLPIIIIIFFLATNIAISNSSDVDKSPKAVQKWFKILPSAKEKLIKLHFYFHDVISGPNRTSIKVAEADITRTSPTSFGLIRMIDNPLTVGPEPDSRIIGRARGMYGAASFDTLDLLMTLTCVFTGGEYKGSSLSMLGHNPIIDKYREMPIVGGTGAFRLARGIVTAQTALLTGSVGVAEYNVVVFYYVNE